VPPESVSVIWLGTWEALPFPGGTGYAV